MTKVYIKVETRHEKARDAAFMSRLAEIAKKIHAQGESIYPTGIFTGKICCECLEDDAHTDCSTFEDYLVYDVSNPNIIDKLLDADFDLYTDYDKFMDRFCELSTDDNVAAIVAAI
ncbi:hypothetical protein D6_00298 [Faustovirus]|nr:hypothetical protein D6_00298 [Faustovirus]AMP44167.1 hypothetical protein PRJ_Dakar_00211 [Faustovirus]